MPRSQPKFNSGLVIQLPLWSDVQEMFVRYKGFFPKKTIQQYRAEKFKRLRSCIDGEWHTARELAELAGIEYKSAVKFLLEMLASGEIVTKTIEVVDSRFRRRHIHLYCKATSTSDLLNAILKTRVPNVPAGLINTQIHRMDK